MELRHLRYFVAVAEELHFGRAAGRLGIAQPPLSQQIRQLEGELEVELFARVGRRVELTESGRTYLADARDILQRVARAGVTARRAARGEAGSLAVGVVPSAIHGLMPRAFRTFRERNPEVAFSLAVTDTGHQVAAIRSGQLQVGFVRPPFGDETLCAEVVHEEPVVAVFPSGRPLAPRTVALRALAKEPLVMFPRDRRPSWYDFILGLCREAGFQPDIALEVADMETALAFVSSGIGVTLAPASVKALHRSGVEYRVLEPAACTSVVALRRSGEPSPVVARFLDVVREVLAASRGAAAAGAPPPHSGRLRAFRKRE